MASTSRSRSSGSRRRQTTRRKNSGSSSRKNPNPKPASGNASAPASAPAPSGLEKALPYIGVGTMTATGINAWKNKEHNDWLKNHPFTPAAGPSGSEPAVNPDNVKVNPKDVKTQGETGTPAPSSSGTVSTGRDPKAEPQNDTGVGVNQSTEQTRQENLKADPESSGLAWGVRQGGRYADATNRAVTNNSVAAGQQAYMNQHGMPTARQSSMDFEAQMQDRNSPLFRQLDRMSGGLYTKQLEWQEKQRGPVQKPSEPASGQKPQAQPSVPAQVKTQGGQTVPQFNVATGGTGGNASPSASPFSFKNYLSEWTKAQAGTGTPASEPPTPPVAPLDVNDPSAQQSLADAGLNADGNPIPEFAPIGSRAEGRELQRDQTTSNLVLGAVQDTSQFADEGVRISAALKADGLKNTLLARSDLSGLKNALPKNASMGAKLGRGVNRGMAGLNLAGGLAAGWEELTGDSYDPMSALFTGGESWGSPSDPELSMKGKRSAAWGGGGLGKTAGVSEAILNSLSMGGYDAMRANMWGGDRYMEERGGAVDADPLNAGYGAEALTDRLFGLWNDWNNPKSDAVKMHEEQRRQAYIAQQVKNNADWNRNNSGFRANPYGV